MLRLLYCAALGLVLSGCADDAMRLAYRGQARLTEKRHVERERAAQRRTTDRLLAAYRECLATGAEREVCWRSLALYRSCVEAGGRDAQCRNRP